MFTGIIRAVGRIGQIADHGDDVRLRIISDGLDVSDWSEGASVAVNGVCLTAVQIDRDGFAADVSVETLRVTTFGKMSQGSPVNLEPALRMGEALDGHLVTGHVDCVAEVAALADSGRGVELKIAVPEAFGRYIARKGSVAVDGVSLTVNDVAGSEFAVMIVPHTRSATIIRHYAPGTPVNIEVDIVARYLERLTDR